MMDFPQVSSTQDGGSRLDRLTEIARALAGEKDLTRLLEAILIYAKRSTNADGGTLYRAADDGQALMFDLVLNDSLHLHLGGTSGKAANFPPMQLFAESGEPLSSSVAAYSAIVQRSVRIDDAYTAKGFDFVGARKFDLANNYRSKSFLTVPMLSHDSQLLGVLQLINARSPQGETIPFSSDDQRFIEALAAQAAIAVENKMLVERLETLFMSFINLINVAIDEKSPYTGGHCQRVPALTMMLAEAASAANRGPLTSFHMEQRDRNELLIAGLLHDCGKITTPVHVVDKATKLETIFDRIELIETRFEVLKRDAEITALQAKLQLMQNAAAQQPAQDLAQQCAQIDAFKMQQIAGLDDACEFVRCANIGQEKTPEADKERIRQLANLRWRGPNGKEQDFLSNNEVENLTIPYGTLTPAERQIINNHIVSTIRMLEALPWPAHLRRVPEYAGGHHERMDGKGYPRGLTREQMSIPARIMGVADIFEALTAKDRPYKRGKTLSESLQILGKMAQTGHVDPDIFDVFVRERVYLEYALKFLDPEQIDQVDHSRIPGYHVAP